MEHVFTLESQRVSLAGSQGVSQGVACEGRAWSAWVPGDRYVLGFASALRFLLRHKFCTDSAKALRMSLETEVPRMQKDRLRTLKDPVVPCQSSMDHGNVKITQNALKVSEPSEC